MGRFLWVLMNFGASADSSKYSRKQFAGQELFWGAPNPCKHHLHPFQTHEGEFLAGKRVNWIRLKAFSFAWAECQERKRRAHCNTLCLQKQTRSVPICSRYPILPSICFEIWISAVPDDFICKNAVGCFCCKSCGREGDEGGGILRHKDNKIIPVRHCDLLLCLVASITSVSLHSIWSGRLSFTLLQAAAASYTSSPSRRGQEGSSST